eukprot:TRINITY_DN5494_c0_g1_i1.p1 TRINITY_DN5494_c0_g1~~TRINITY_DN5494_c0_g1_i1.p1  ORF type:complete len:124 (+),score=10.01 TRINITY_DN5494_c0_g1_i1:260-631(+)
MRLSLMSLDRKGTKLPRVLPGSRSWTTIQLSSVDFNGTENATSGCSGKFALLRSRTGAETSAIDFSSSITSRINEGSSATYQFEILHGSIDSIAAKKAQSSPQANPTKGLRKTGKEETAAEDF